MLERLPATATSTTPPASAAEVVAEPPAVALPDRSNGLAQRLFDGTGWLLLRLVSDVVLLLAAVAAAYVGAGVAGVDTEGAGLIAAYPAVVLALMAWRGMYWSKIQARLLDGLGTIVAATSLAAISLIAAAAFFDSGADPAPLVARAWFFASVYLAAGRLVLELSQRRARVQRAVGKRTLIVGAGQIGAQVERRLREQPELGLRPVGFLDSDPPPSELVPERVSPVLGDPEEVARVAHEQGASHVILAFTSAPDSVLLPLVRECEQRRLEISLVPRLFESVNVRVGLEHLGGLPLYGLRSVDPKGWQFAVKHALDRAVALLMLASLAPVLAACAIAVRLSSAGPVFFRQRRIGRDGHEFDMLKFRTMEGSPEEHGEFDAGWAAQAAAGAGGPVLVAAAEPQDTAGRPQENDDRRTGVGALLRRWSLDELPQLINVLRGDMSLVGPRPERAHYVRMFEQSVRRYGDRHRVRSGLTGWAQVHGLRGNTSLADRVEWDNWYVQNWSLGLDAKILLMTVSAFFRPPE